MWVRKRAKHAVFNLLAESVLIPLGLTTSAPATNATIQKKVFWTKKKKFEKEKRISNKEMDDIMKIIKSLKEYNLLIKGVGEKNQKRNKRTKSWIS